MSEVHPIPTRKNFNNLTGRTFGRWTVISFAGTQDNTRNRRLWHCHCECGTRRTLTAYNLLSEATTSCGCYIREVTSKRSLTNGLSQGGKRAPGYYVWIAMIGRCTNPSHADYPNYGERGIRVCERWSGENGYHHFMADVGPKPSSKHSLDRFPNQNGNYEPGNVRWATQSEQMRNVRYNRIVTLNGKSQCVAAWAEELHVNESLIRRRLNYGWPVEDALLKPVRPHKLYRRKNSLNVADTIPSHLNEAIMDASANHPLAAV